MVLFQEILRSITDTIYCMTLWNLNLIKTYYTFTLTDLPNLVFDSSFTNIAHLTNLSYSSSLHDVSPS